MQVVRTALVGLAVGAAAGFVVALLRPRARSHYAGANFTPGRP